MFRTIEYGTGQNLRRISLVPYNSEKEREILLACTLNDFDETGKDGLNIEKVYESLKNYINPFYNDLSKNEMKLILLNLRSISVGDESPNKSYCPHCNKVNDKPISLSGVLSNKEKELDDYIILDDIIFYFKDSFDENSPEINLINRCVIKSKRRLRNGILSSFTTNSEMIKEIVGDLSLKDYQSLIDFINESRTKFNFLTELKCINCGEITLIDISSERFIIESLSEDNLVSFYKTIADLVFYGKYAKEDVYKMIPFERNIYFGLLQAQIEEYRQANPR